MADMTYIALSAKTYMNKVLLYLVPHDSDGILLVHQVIG
jgi:hypothetical protein